MVEYAEDLTMRLQLRRGVLQDAQHALALCLEAETRAESDAYAIERRITEATKSAADPSTSDDAVEAFGRWFKAEWSRLLTARKLLENLQADTARERAVLNACRVALERCEQRAAAGGKISPANPE